jgi:hypothetical protein
MKPGAVVEVCSFELLAIHLLTYASRLWKKISYFLAQLFLLGNHHTCHKHPPFVQWLHAQARQLYALNHLKSDGGPSQVGQLANYTTL